MSLREFVRRFGVPLCYTPGRPLGLLASTRERATPALLQALGELATDGGPEHFEPGLPCPELSESVQLVARTLHEGWTYDLRQLAFARHYDRRIEKLCWHPLTGAVHLVPPPQRHATVLDGLIFEDYIRAILLPDHGLVATRAFWPSWRQDAGPYSEFGPEDRILSFAVQEAFRRRLPQLGSLAPTFVFNITNTELEALTGRHGW